MQVIPPLEITDARLTSTNIPEEVAATYAGGTTYALGNRAGAAPVYGAAQTVWESLQNGNIGHTQEDGAWWKNVGIAYPVYNSGSSCDTGGIVTDLATHTLYESLVDANTGNALSDDTKWLNIGPTNARAMFDLIRNTKTTSPDQIVIVVAPGMRCTAIGLAGMVANAYSLVITSVILGGEIYNESGSLNSRNTLSWSDYFFGEFTTKPGLAFFGIPPAIDAVITLTLTGAGDVSIGAFVVGKNIYLGATQYSATSDVLNFSSVERDTFGTATLIPRRNVPKTTQQVICAKERVNKVRAARDSLNAEPAIWYGIDDGSDGYFESLTILGIYKQFSIALDRRETATISLELEEI